MPQAVKRRSYDSTRRREQARATRRVILNAARELFVDSGYAATSIEAIAAQARVSPETVYAAFKNKRALLREIIDASIAGDDAPVPVLERSWVQEIRQETDIERRLQILARNGRLILERIAPIYEVLRGAVAADRGIVALSDRYKTQRLEGQAELLRILITGHQLRKGLTRASAVDVLFAIGSPETYGLLVYDRGWSPDLFERWYANTLRLLLFP